MQWRVGDAVLDCKNLIVMVYVNGDAIKMIRLQNQDKDYDRRIKWRGGGDAVSDCIIYVIIPYTIFLILDLI